MQWIIQRWTNGDLNALVRILGEENARRLLPRALLPELPAPLRAAVLHRAHLLSSAPRGIAIRTSGKS